MKKSINDLRKEYGLQPIEDGDIHLEKMNKAIEYERSFGQRQNPDIIKKRMDSDLFKGSIK